MLSNNSEEIINLIKQILQKGIFDHKIENKDFPILLESIRKLAKADFSIKIVPVYTEFWEDLFMPEKPLEIDEELGPSDFAPGEIWTYYICECGRTSSHINPDFGSEFIHECYLCGKAKCPYCAYDLQTYWCDSCQAKVEKLLHDFPVIKENLDKIQLQDKDYFIKDDKFKDEMDYQEYVKSELGEIEQTPTRLQESWRLKFGFPKNYSRSTLIKYWREIIGAPELNFLKVEVELD